MTQKMQRKTECRLFSTKLEYDDLMVIDVDSNEHNINDVINERKRKLCTRNESTAI